MTYFYLPGQESEKVRNRNDPFRSAGGIRKGPAEVKVFGPREISSLSDIPSGREIYSFCWVSIASKPFKERGKLTR